MRAYIIVTPETIENGLDRNVKVMTNYLSFDLTEALRKKKQRNGDIILYQDLPMSCEKCNLADDTVVYHHYYGRRYHHLEDHACNRIPLCAEHHNLSSEFSAHLTPTLFNEWILEKRGAIWLAGLTEEAHKFK